ncbi:MAG: inositol monophosphatase family protein [Pseudomonadota bacterium]
MHPMLNIAVRSARAGGRVLTRHMDRLDSIKVETKGHKDFVSEVDRLTENEIIQTLTRSYPDHGFICEESGVSGNPDAEFKWYIDPLDGTKNYLHGYPSFCVSIAVAQNNRLEQAVIYNPISQELFTATRGAGATLDGKRLRVAKRSSIDTALLSSSFGHSAPESYRKYRRTLDAFTDSAAGIRKQGSAALDIAFVAAGRLDGYWQFGLKPWDVAAGALLVREAGGLIGDMRGEDSWLETGNVVAASPKIFDPMIRTFQRLGITEL